MNEHERGDALTVLAGVGIVLTAIFFGLVPALILGVAFYVGRRVGYLIGHSEGFADGRYDQRRELGLR